MAIEDAVVGMMQVSPGSVMPDFGIEDVSPMGRIGLN